MRRGRRRQCLMAFWLLAFTLGGAGCRICMSPPCVCAGSALLRSNRRAVSVAWIGWSHNSRHVVFIRKANAWTVTPSPAGGAMSGEQVADLHIIPATGGRARRLARVSSGRRIKGGSPAPGSPVAVCSPTEPVVLYQRYRCGRTEKHQLRAIGLDGRRDRLLWKGQCRLWRWSPDGTSVLFCHAEGPADRWYVTQAEGGAVLDITAAHRKAVGPFLPRMTGRRIPRWNRDGDALWYIVAGADNTSLDLWRVELPSLKVTHVSRHPLADENRILVTIRDKLAPGEPEAFTNRSPERLVSDRVREWGIYGHATIVAAASPDGSAIAVGLTADRDTAERKAGAYLYVCSPDGKERKLIWSEMSDLK